MTCTMMTMQFMYHVVAGGNRDKLKADRDRQRFEHMRVAKLVSATHTKNAEAQLVEFLKGKLPDKIIPCMCQGSALGCLRDTCPYDHTWSTKITEPELKALKMYYAWCVAKADGTMFEYNVTWMTLEEAKTQRTKKLALTIKVTKLLRDSGYGPHNAPAEPVDPSAVRSRTRSKTRGVAGGRTADVRQLASEERAALIRPTRGASSFNEQATLAACDKVEVAEEGRLQGCPDLLPNKNVSLIWKSLTSADWPSQTLGNVQVQSMSSLTLETHDVPTLGKYGFNFFIIDADSMEASTSKCSCASATRLPCRWPTECSTRWNRLTKLGSTAPGHGSSITATVVQSIPRGKRSLPICKRLTYLRRCGVMRQA